MDLKNTLTASDHLCALPLRMSAGQNINISSVITKSLVFKKVTPIVLLKYLMGCCFFLLSYTTLKGSATIFNAVPPHSEEYKAIEATRVLKRDQNE